MAGDSESEDRSLEPSERRLQKAREEGRFPQSRDLSFLALLVLVILFVLLGGKGAWHACERLVHDALDLSTRDEPLEHLADWIGGALLEFTTWLALFLLAAFLVGLLGPLALARLRPVWAPRVDFARLDPVAGLRRLFQAQQLFALAKGVVVTLALVGVGTLFLLRRVDGLVLAPGASLRAGVAQLAEFVAEGGQWLLGVVAVVAFVDAAFQWRNFHGQLRMSVQELKEEQKESEGSPQVRARIRGLQRQAARRRMMAAVERADVVVVNPTHYAVALRYDPERMRAPVVVGKGEDELALRMREVARRHTVPIAEAPVLARWLTAHVPLGDALPESLYAVAAQLLAWAYDARDRGVPAPLPPLDDAVGGL